MQTSNNARQASELPARLIAAATRRGLSAMVAAGLLLLANIVVPLVWGDLYPFTSAPMFRDAPQLYCDYTVYTVDGREIDSERFLCQRIYDGNPVGYGVGRAPPLVLERFGEVRDASTILAHVRAQLERAENRELRQVEVVQKVVGPTPGGEIAVVKTERWHVSLNGHQP